MPYLKPIGLLLASRLVEMHWRAGNLCLFKNSFKWHSFNKTSWWGRPGKIQDTWWSPHMHSFFFFFFFSPSQQGPILPQPCCWEEEPCYMSLSGPSSGLHCPSSPSPSDWFGDPVQIQEDFAKSFRKLVVIRWDWCLRWHPKTLGIHWSVQPRCWALSEAYLTSGLLNYMRK